MSQTQFLQRIGRVVRDTRLRLDLSQLQVAERAGVQRYQVANLELGKGNPSMKTLAAVLGALHLNLSVAPKDKAHAMTTSRLRPPVDLDEVLRRSRL